MERLNKIIAHAGIASRRKADQLILEKRVTVDGKLVTNVGIQVNPDMNTICVDGKPLPRNKPAVYIFNKPKGVVCSRVRQKNEKIITDFFPPFPPVYSVGRLDKDSEGLILVTNQGHLAHVLTHPSYLHRKEYYVRARFEDKAAEPDLAKVKHRLLKGVKLGDGLAKADSVEIELINNKTLRLVITVHEGRTHLIRRMCASVGLDVILLRRTKFATLTLTNLRSGQYRSLNESEIHKLQSLH